MKGTQSEMHSSSAQLMVELPLILHSIDNNAIVLML
jgi:hypothetical protein